MSLRGVVPPLVTPFHEDGSHDLEAFSTTLEALAVHDFAGFLVLGSNGEAASLEENEKLQLVAAARREASAPSLVALCAAACACAAAAWAVSRAERALSRAAVAAVRDRACARDQASSACEGWRSEGAAWAPVAASTIARTIGLFMCDLRSRCADFTITAQDPP